MRISVDIGGTFTDLVVETPGELRLFKAPTVPADPLQGIVDVLDVAAAALDVSRAALLGATEMFIHATTRGLNAVLTGTTARTAFLTTAGHPDVLLLREGGREDPFDFSTPFPEPYVPRALTFEVPGRITSDGSVIEDLDPAALEPVCRQLAAAEVEAVAVCLLWSTVNPAHETRVGEALATHLPGVPFTLSHEINPSLREYRRASSAAIDASLKPVMTDYLRGLTERLRESGFGGRLLMVTSSGGVLDIDDVARAPIHSINSGPSMAPVAGRAYAATDAGSDVVIVADAGGTTYDVTLVRGGQIPWTRAAWVGPAYTGHMTGLPSIDVKSVGAGGGSTAWVDAGGLLHVGPQSAGSDPGPACYGRGGTAPTVTDAALVLGYLDPGVFSGGAMRLDRDASIAAIDGAVAGPLGLERIAAADAIMRLATEQMVRAIEEITLQQGIDPAAAVLIGGGGAAGLNAVPVAQRLGCRQLVVPVVGAALAAAGALMSDLMGAYAVTAPTTTDAFDTARVNDAIDGLRARCAEFVEKAGTDPADARVQVYAEARYPQQIWELEVPIRVERFTSEDDVRALVADFHAVHEQVLGIADVGSEVEIVSWGARVHCPLRDAGSTLVARGDDTAASRGTRPAYFPGLGVVDTPVRTLASLGPDEVVTGPVLVESAFTTVVIPDGATCGRGPSGSLSIDPRAAEVPS